MNSTRSTPENDKNMKMQIESSVKKERRKRQKLLINELLTDYSRNSTLHGPRYIVESVHSIEKAFWVFTFLISIAMCVYLITNVWIKWKTSPVIVSFSERVVPVGDVPFPSITICPQMKSKASVYNFSDEYNKYIKKMFENENSSYVEGEWDKLDDIDMICSIEDDAVMSNRDLANSSMIEHFYEVAPTAEDLFVYCQWRGRDFDCESTFKSVITYEGICYNFNALAADEILRTENLQKEFKYLNTTRPSKHWSLAGGYTDFVLSETYPRRGRENNASPDLRVILQESPEDRDDLCNSIWSGYSIFVQHPTDLPQSSLYYYSAINGQVTALALRFNKLSTDEGLRGYDPEIRQCYFPEDRQLRYFRIYTPNNCRLECQSNYTFEQCGCVWFHMPHNDSRQICVNANSTTCMTDTLDKLSLAELDSKSNIDIKPCRCLPSCDSVQYDAEVLKSTYDVHKYLKSQEKIFNYSMSDLTSKNLSEINVYFKEPRFISMRRSELFGVTDFVANCGGLLGLFLGFSFLSVVEIVYYITIRLFTILRRDLKEEKENHAGRDQNA